MKRQLITGAEAVRVTRQHTTPCDDCPFARTALRGWLGDASPAAWIAMAHGETRIECHTRVGPGRVGFQCVGAATYRANVCKMPRDPSQLRRPPDPVAVFATPAEFRAHHTIEAPRMTPKPRQLGERQHHLLQSLATHRGWSRGCGWVWDTERGTERLLAPLVARGLVEAVEHTRPGWVRVRSVLTPGTPVTYTHYQLTAAGKAAAARPR